MAKFDYKTYKYRIIVAGGRKFTDFDLLCEKLDKLLSNLDKSEILIIAGGAKGADTLAVTYAISRGIKYHIEYAQWNLPNGLTDYSAGHTRNVKMASMATHLVAFWDGRSSGTKDMLEIARICKLTVREVRYGFYN